MCNNCHYCLNTNHSCNVQICLGVRIADSKVINRAIVTIPKTVGNNFKKSAKIDPPVTYVTIFLLTYVHPNIAIAMVVGVEQSTIIVDYPHSNLKLIKAKGGDFVSDHAIQHST